MTAKIRLQYGTMSWEFEEETIKDVLILFKGFVHIDKLR